jgi:cobalt/nickel transport system ATP-binding protein
MDAGQMILEAKGISFAYQGGKSILDGLDFSLREREKVGIVGHNGSGKTTFLHLLLGLVRPTAGKLRLFGSPVSQESHFAPIRSRLGLLFQDPDDQLFCPTVLEDVAFGPLNQGKNGPEAESIARQVLDDVGIGDLANRVTYRLSGGEKKLVSLAAVMSMSPDVLLLDEPTNGLDESTRLKITSLLKRLDLPMVVISHEYDFLASVAERFYVMKHGRLSAEEGTVLHSHYHVHDLGGYPHQHQNE